MILQFYAHTCTHTDPQYYIHIGLPRLTLIKKINKNMLVKMKNSEPAIYFCRFIVKSSILHYVMHAVGYFLLYAKKYHITFLTLCNHVGFTHKSDANGWLDIFLSLFFFGFLLAFLALCLFLWAQPKSNLGSAGLYLCLRH